MGDHANLLLGAGVAFDEQAARGVGHDDHELRMPTQLGEHFELMRGRRREHGVQRHDEWLRELLRE